MLGVKCNKETPFKRRRKKGSAVLQTMQQKNETKRLCLADRIERRTVLMTNPPKAEEENIMSPPSSSKLFEEYKSVAPPPVYSLELMLNKLDVCGGIVSSRGR